MRITTQMLYSQFNYNLQNIMNSTYQTDEQIASGQKLNKPSDDPAAVSGIISGEAQLSSIAGYQNAITNTSQLLNSTNTALDSLNALISEAKKVGLNATSGTASDINTYASMIGNLIQSTISIANTKVGDTYIFSGYATDIPAVDATGVLHGTSNSIQMQVNTGTSVKANVTAAGLIASGTYPDSTTIIGVMKTLQADITANNQAGIQVDLTNLSTLSSTVLADQADVGERLNMLDSEKQILTARDTDITNSVSDKLMLSTVDVARLSAMAQQQQTALSSLRTITNGVLNTSLFDFLK